MEKRTPALLIFDADGTLRRATVPGQPCPNRPGEWELLPGVKETLSRMDWGEDGAILGIASNQGGVALGYLSEEMARRLLVDMVIEAIGFLPARTFIEMCTCAPHEDCECRKPRPGMLLEIMRRAGVSRKETLFVGDLEKDKEAARRAGVRFMWAREFFSQSWKA